MRPPADTAGDAGFAGIGFCRPAAATNSPAVFDGSVLSKEWEATPECPHTLVMEAQKPISPAGVGR